MLYSTAYTEINIFRAWKCVHLFFHWVLMWWFVLILFGVQLGLKFVVAMVSLSEPQTSNSFSDTLCLECRLVYHSDFPQSILPRENLCCAALSEKLHQCFCSAPVSVVLGGMGQGAFSDVLIKPQSKADTGIWGRPKCSCSSSSSSIGLSMYFRFSQKQNIFNFSVSLLHRQWTSTSILR